MGLYLCHNSESEISYFDQCARTAFCGENVCLTKKKVL